MTARAGESVILGCDVSPPLDGQQPPYVVEWFKFGVPIPFFINFRFYPPHVDPEYTGEMPARARAPLIPCRLEVNEDAVTSVSRRVLMCRLKCKMVILRF